MGDQTEKARSWAFGLIVVGDEVLNGSRGDKHLAHFKAVVRDRGHELAWHWILPDEPRALVDHLRFSMSRTDPVFVCGGIGATPDDHTRACAAEASGSPLVRHPEAQALIEARFGAEAHPFRILMADLPAGCELIPNPYNRIPGFSVRRHFFLPGFPQMAWPMAASVLDRDFGDAENPVLERSVRVTGVPESRLVPIMRDIGPRHPGLKLFSLPHLGPDPCVLLGFRGRSGVDQAMRDLCEALDKQEMTWVQDQPAEAAACVEVNPGKDS
jgi:molybdopterin-biosynthesis enzyme MoeA-like protein